MDTDDNQDELISTQPISNDDDVDLRGIDEVLIRDSIILKCKYVFKTNDAVVPEFKTLNDLLSDMLKLNRKMLIERVLPRIPFKEMGQTLDHDVYNWLTNDGPILVVKFLPYLSIACQMKFYRCEIKNYNNHRVFEPVERNHEISTAIYYICNNSQQTIQGIFITNCAYTEFRINHNYKQIMQTSLHDYYKIQFYKQLISDYTEQIKTFHFHQHLLLLSKWQNIYNCYMGLDRLGHKRNSIETLSYCRCLIMLSKYSTAEEELRKLLSDTVVNTVEVWHLLAKAQRKRKQFSGIDIERINYQNYSKAKQSISTAVILAVTLALPNETIVEEQIIIDNLIKRRFLKQMSLKQSVEYKRRTSDCLAYNILSIDGGGIRGIMAAIWLRELERKTNRNCSSMFRMMAGTSTGAIIAAGLSMPATNSLTEPAYDSSKLVELYKSCGRHIFAKKTRPFYDYRNISILAASKYSSNGKRKLFETYFGETLLRECLTDIVIPTVRTGDVHTHLFTRNNCLFSTRLVDVLMATTAAPTYFDPHVFNNTSYIDGGVQMNNPALAAYTKAIEYGYDKSNIFVLSLGTGDHLLEPLVTDKERDLIFYHGHKEDVIKVLLDSQQHNVDYQMGILMNDRNYNRWQVWFERPIDLDTYEPNIVNDLENIAYEYWEEMESYDGIRLNRLIEHLKNE